MYKLLFLLFPIFMNAQDIFNNQKIDSVYAIINYSGANYYYTDSGFVQFDNGNKKDINQEYTDYYRKIYGDSTIQNPNLILSGQNTTIVPLININDFIKNNAYGLDFNDLIQTEQNKFTIKPESMNKIEKYLMSLL